MNQNLPTKELLIAIVQKGDSILMRKKTRRFATI